MRGKPNFNHPAFKEAARALRSSGWRVISPAEKDVALGIEVPANGNTDKKLRDFPIGEDLKDVAESDAVFVLPGWEGSEGARLEVHVAHTLGVPVYSYETTAEVLIGYQGYGPRGEPIYDPHGFSVKVDKTAPEGLSLMAEALAAMAPQAAGSMRLFETGATRNVDESRPDYEGFLSPLVIERFGEYMNANRLQADGNVRSSDNWQKGIPLDSYMKSGWRHFFSWWKLHRSEFTPDEDIETALCALLFNVSGYLHETLQKD